MSSSSSSISYPKIDKRAFDDILKELRQYVPFYTPEWDATTNDQDPGVALSKIFSNILAFVIDRLNKVPQRNYIEFLNMLGVKLIPAQPARGFVTFALSEAVKEDVLIPAGTKLTVAATDKHRELTFETEENMLATRAKLQEVYSVVNNIDAIYRHTSHLKKKGDNNNSFSFFSGANDSSTGSGNLQKHILYLGHKDLFNIKKNIQINLQIHSLTAENAQNLKKLLENADWEYNWKVDPDTGEEIASKLYVIKGGGGKVPPPKSDNDIEIALSFSNQGDIKFDKELYDITDDKTMTLTLDLTTTTAATIATGDYSNTQTVILRSTTDPKGISVNLTETTTNSRVFTATVGLTTTDSSSSDNQGKKFTLRVKQGDTITAIYQDPRQASTASIINARGKPEIEKFKFNGVDSRWIRCSLVPFENSIQEEKEYFESLNNQIINIIQLTVIPVKSILYPDMLFYNNVLINFKINDVSGEFEHIVLPFGEKPLTLDTFYVASEDAFSKKGAEVTLTFKGQNLNLDANNPVLSWEYWNGKGWANLNPKIPPASSSSIPIYEVVFTCPADIEKISVNGNDNYWIRVRIAFDNYAKNRYPKLNKLEIKFKMPPQFPEQLQTYNNLDYQTNIIKIDGTNKPFIPFAKLENTHPSIYFGFDQPLEKGTIMLFFSITELQFPENLLPNIDYYYYSSSTGGWRKLDSVVDDTKDLSRRGVVKFLFPPADFAARSMFGKNLYWLKAVDTEDRFAPRPRSFGWEEILAGYGNCNYPWDFLASNFNLKLLADPKIMLKNVDIPSSFAISSKAKKKLPRLGAIKSKPVIRLGNRFCQIFAIKLKSKLSMGGRRSELLTFYIEDTPLPQIKGIFLNTVLALNVVTTDDEILGTSNDMPGQIFRFMKKPVTCTDKFKNQVWVNEGKFLTDQERNMLLVKGEIEEIKDQTGNVIQTWVRWHEIDDIYTSNNSTGRYFELDRAVGEVLFGDGSNGKIPPVGRENIKADYTAGGGSEGNVEPTEINALKTTVPFVDSVVNPEAAEGGLDVETVKSALLRGPQRIRNRGQAVSPDDFEWLVYENFPSIAKVKCLPNTSINGKFTAGKITIVLVPSSSEEKPIASLGLISKVQQYLEEHSSNVVVTSKNLKVIRPLYLRISIFVDVYPVSIDLAPVAEQAVITRLKLFLNPLTGGPEGKGWDFGRMVCTSDIFFLLENIVEIDHIDNLSIKVEIDEDVLLQSTRESILQTSSSFSSSSYSALSFSATSSSSSSSSISIDKTAGGFPDPPLPPYSLIYSGKHTVTLKFEKGNGGE